MGPFDTLVPFGGDLSPPGATGAQSQPRPGGWQHVSIYTDGAHVSYDMRGNEVRGVHATVHDATGGGQHLTLEPRG